MHNRRRELTVDAITRRVNGARHKMRYARRWLRPARFSDRPRPRPPPPPPPRIPRANDAIYCFCRRPAYPARYIFSTLLLLGVVCHVNFARAARGWPSGAFNALPPPSRWQAASLPPHPSASIRPNHRPLPSQRDANLPDADERVN